MYIIIDNARKNIKKDHHYLLKKVEDYDELMLKITVPIIGDYSIGVHISKMLEVERVIKDDLTHSRINLYIYCNESMINALMLRNSNIQVRDSVSPFEMMKELIIESELPIEIKAYSILYSSLPKDMEKMSIAIKNIKEEYPDEKFITEKMLSEIMILSKLTYPRQVLVDYLTMRRWRGQNLKKALEDFGSEITLYAMIKNIKKILKDKQEYLSSGVGNKQIRLMNTNNILRMFDTLVLSRDNMQDIEFLLRLYERGETVNCISEEVSKV